MKRWLLFAAAVCLTAAGGYVASPFVAAWNIREAVRDGDAGYLKDKIEWTSVKETLKPSLTRMALNLPDETAGAPAPRPGLWQRFKAYVGKGAVNRAIDSYVTPEGLPQLFSYRQAYRSAVGQVDEPKTLANLPDRIAKVWARVLRADFMSLTRFEMTMRDKFDEDRIIDGVLELKGFDWKLTELRLRSAQGANAVAGGAWDAAKAMARPD